MQFGKLHGKPMNRFSPGQDGEKNPMVSCLQDFARNPFSNIHKSDLMICYFMFCSEWSNDNMFDF